MKITRHREKDGGPIINWLASVVGNFGLWLVHLTHDYVVTNIIEFEDEDLNE